ncbi:MAG: hypothetical protein AAF747_10605, partial [Planctomycetota bacterium]
SEITIVERDRGAGFRPEGRLTHDLPGPLTDVKVYFVRSQRPLTRTEIATRRSVSWQTVNSLDALGQAVAVNGDWNPSEPLDLGSLFADARRTSLLAQELRSIRPRPAGVGLTGEPQAGTRDERLLAASFFNQLPGPAYDAGGEPSTSIRRDITQSLDLSAWLTQPCVIVMGILDGEYEVPTPIEVRTNGSTRTVNPVGKTVVRWVYPLPSDPPRIIGWNRDAEDIDTNADNASGDEG